MKQVSLRYNIKKIEETETDTDTDTDTYTDTDTNIENDYEYSSESKSGGGSYKYTSLSQTNYKGKSKQAEFTMEQIKEKLNGYKPLKTSKDKEYLFNLNPFTVWIKYINIETHEFRTGGLLKLVDKDLKYIMLVNVDKGITWSVQLKNNMIFVPDPKKAIEKEKVYKEKQREEIRVKLQKDKLYKLWQDGKLRKKDI